MKRKEFIKLMAASALTMPVLGLKALDSITQTTEKKPKMPALFLAHGHPINAIKESEFTKMLKGISKNIETPTAIMVISAHWETRGTFVSINPNPKTIYDFGRFDDRLFDIKYEPKGSPELAKEVIKLNEKIQANLNMGLDHGAWTILKHIYPEANIPVFQLSLDYTINPTQHFQLAQQLSELRNRGVLIIGSGNIVHNLQKVSWGNADSKPYDWVLEFDMLVKNKLEENNFKDLTNFTTLGTAAKLSIPSDEHYLPMLYVLAMKEKNENITQIYEGYEYSSLSMRSFKIS